MPFKYSFRSNDVSDRYTDLAQELEMDGEIAQVLHHHEDVALDLQVATEAG
ncbi:hypothetical protein D3C71_2124120 [compost metagenome]